MKRHLIRITFVAILVFTSAIALGTAAATAKTATPTPTPSVTPTPAGEAPAAPSDLRVSATGMTWTDNSANEDGFLIDLTVCMGNEFQQDLHYEAPANTTSFTFPPDYFAALNRCACGGYVWKVTAFNPFGSASTLLQTGIPSCAPAATATPTTVALPSTGTGDAGTGFDWRAVALGIAFVGGATVACARLRRDHRTQGASRDKM